VPLIVCATSAANLASRPRTDRSVSIRTSDPSGRMTHRSPLGCGLNGVSAISSLKPPRTLVNTIHSPSGDHELCASFPAEFVSRRRSVPFGRIV
jgi:hypothetical protein